MQPRKSSTGFYDSSEGVSLRCAACNVAMKNNPLFIKDREGNKVVNDLCSRCTFIARYPEYAEIPEDEELQVLKGILDAGDSIKMSAPLY